MNQANDLLKGDRINPTPSTITQNSQPQRLKSSNELENELDLNQVAIDWLQLALRYHRLGWAVSFMGCTGGASEPQKTPFGTWAQFASGSNARRQTTADIKRRYDDILCRVFDKNPTITGIGLHSGKYSNNYACLDFDGVPQDQIDDILQTAFSILALPDGYVWLVKSGKATGYHVWVQLPEDSKFPAKIELKCGGVMEIRHTGGYTVAPFSTHPSGKQYTFVYSQDIPDTPPQLVTEYQLNQLIEAVGAKQAKPDRPRPPRHASGDKKPLSDSLIREVEGYLQMRGMEYTNQQWSRRFSCPCPAHKNGDKKPSAGYDQQAHVVKCWSTKTVYMLSDVCGFLGIDWQSLKAKHASIEKTSPPAKTQSAPSQTPPTPRRDGNTLYIDCQYISDQLPALADLPRLTCIKSSVGTGKTYAITRAIPDGATVLIVTPRNSLNRNLSKRLEGLGFVSHLDGKGDLWAEPRVICSLDSLHKLRVPDDTLPSFDYVILDESEMLLKHNVGDMFKGVEGQAALHLLFSFAERSQHTFLMDANLGRNTAKFLHLFKALDQQEALYIVNEYRRQDLPPVYVLPSMGDVRAKALELAAAGKKILIGTDSNGETQDLEQLLADYNALAIHGDNSQTPDIQEAITAIDDTVANHTVSFSPTISIGVDIQTPVDAFIGVYYGNILTAEEIYQQLGRARHISGAIYLYIPNDASPTARKTDDETAIIEHELNQYNSERKVLSAIYDKEGKPLTGSARVETMAIDTRRHFALWATVQAKDNGLFNRQRSGLVELLTSEGYSVNVLPALDKPTEQSKAANKAVKEQRTQRKELEAVAILKADPLNEDEYKRKQLTGQAEPDDHFRVDRDKLEQIYRPDNVDRPLVDEYLAHGKNGAMGRYTWLVMTESQLADLDINESELSPHLHKKRVLFRRLMYTLLSKSIKQTHSTRLDTTAARNITFTQQDLQLFQKHALDPRWRPHVQSLLHVNPASYKNPAQLLQAILKAIGLGLISERVTDETTGKRIRVYQIDPERVRIMAEHATQRLLSDDTLDYQEVFLNIPRAYAPPAQLKPIEHQPAQLEAA